MKEIHKRTLIGNRLELARSLCLEEILQFLVAKAIISDEVAERIESKRTRFSRNVALLSLIPTRGPKAYEVFIQGLRAILWIKTYFRTISINIYVFSACAIFWNISELEENEKSIIWFVTPIKITWWCCIYCPEKFLADRHYYKFSILITHSFYFFASVLQIFLEFLFKFAILINDALLS